MHCTKTPEMEEFELLTADLKFKIEHPFRVFEGTAKALQGTLVANPKSPKEGLSVAVSFGTDKVESASQILIDLGRGAAQGNAKIEFVSTVAEYPPGMLFGGKPFKFRLHGEVRYRGGAQVIDVPTQCSLKGEFWECLVEFSFQPSEVMLPTPAFFKIPSRDQIVAKGEVNFGPKREK